VLFSLLELDGIDVEGLIFLGEFVAGPASGPSLFDLLDERRVEVIVALIVDEERPMLIGLAVDGLCDLPDMFETKQTDLKQCLGLL
jgi:hypothetical protein